MNTMLCSVSGIENKDGKSRLKKGLEKIEGVRSVGVNLQTGTVKIEFEEPATELRLKSCMEDEGCRIVYE